MMIHQVEALIKRLGGFRVSQRGSQLGKPSRSYDPIKFSCPCGSHRGIIPYRPEDLPARYIRVLERSLEPCFGSRWLSKDY